MENKLSVREVLENNVASITQKKELDPKVKLTIAENLTSLKELQMNNSYVFEKVMNATNKQTTFMTIAHNSLVGAVINKDFWILPFGNKIVEVKTGQFWKNLAVRFSVKPIDDILVQVIKKGDNYKFSGMPTRMVEYSPSFNSNGNDFEQIEGVYGEVRYTDGTYSTRVITKPELVDLREKSPSGSNGKQSPWNDWAAKMCESKALREIVLRNVVMDQAKISEYSYGALIKDEQPLQVRDGQLINDTFEIKEVKEAPKKVIERQANSIADDIEASNIDINNEAEVEAFLDKVVNKNENN